MQVEEKKAEARQSLYELEKSYMINCQPRNIIDEESDSNNDSDAEENINCKRKYLPVKVSAVYLHIESIKKEFIQKKKKGLSYAQWHCLLVDSVSSSSTDPDD